VKAIAGRVALALIIGIAIGLAGGLYFARFVEAILLEIEPVSVWAFSLPLLCLLLVAVAATWAPLRRAIRVDPAEALRTE
jgi:putative ABC transport system permease protein